MPSPAPDNTPAIRSPQPAAPEHSARQTIDQRILALGEDRPDILPHLEELVAKLPMDIHEALANLLDQRPTALVAMDREGKPVAQHLVDLLTRMEREKQEPRADLYIDGEQQPTVRRLTHAFADVLARLTQPNVVTQGNHGTCAAASMSYIINCSAPGEYVRIACGLLTENAVCVGLEYKEPNLLVPCDFSFVDGSPDRTRVDAVFQSALKNFCANSESGEYYSNANDRFERREKNGSVVITRKAGLPDVAVAAALSRILGHDYRAIDREETSRIAEALPNLCYLTLHWSDNDQGIPEHHAIVNASSPTHSAAPAEQIVYYNPQGNLSTESAVDFSGNEPHRTSVPDRVGFESMETTEFWSRVSGAVISEYELGLIYKTQPDLLLAHLSAAHSQLSAGAQLDPNLPESTFRGLSTKLTTYLTKNPSEISLADTLHKSMPPENPLAIAFKAALKNVRLEAPAVAAKPKPPEATPALSPATAPETLSVWQRFWQWLKT